MLKLALKRPETAAKKTGFDIPVLFKTSEKRQHHAEWITDRSWNMATSLLILGAIVVTLLMLWQMRVDAAVDNTGLYYSSPKLIYRAFVDHFWDNLWHTGLTAVRGLSAILIGFYLVYPLGSLAALSGRWVGVFLAAIIILMSIPLLTIYLYFPRATGLTLTTVMILGCYSAFIKMIAMGFFDTHFFIRDDEAKDMLYSVQLEGANRLQFYWYILSPLMLTRRLSTLYILSAIVWNSVAFGESYVGGQVGGAGVIMGKTAESFYGRDRLFAVAIMLMLLMLIGWALIYFLSIVYKRAADSNKTWVRHTLSTVNTLLTAWSVYYIWVVFA